MICEADKDFLWTFCGLSVDYILNVCCAETIGGLLRTKYCELCGEFLQEQTESCDKTVSAVSLSAGYSVQAAPFDLYQKALKEFYALLSLDNLTFREQLQGDLFDYMLGAKTDRINPWGYFDFRLGRYQELISRAVNNTLNQYIESMDYKKCLRLIGEAAIHSEHKVKVLHVIFLLDGKFILLNEKNEVLEAAEISEEIGTAVTLGLKLDDALAEAFIYYAPEKIVVHNYNNSKSRVSPAIWDMAGVGVSFCEGCERCAKYAVPIFADI